MPRWVSCLVLFFFYGCASWPAYCQEEAIAHFIRQLQTMEPNSRYVQREFELTQLLFRARLATSTVEGSAQFRKLDDVELLNKVVQLASSEDQKIRVEASLILANVTDNTTLCAVLNGVLESDLNSNSRVNFLQIIDINAPGSFMDTSDWIRRVVQIIGSDLEQNVDARMSLDLLSSISERLPRQIVRGNQLALEAPREYAQCMQLQNIREVIYR